MAMMAADGVFVDTNVLVYVSRSRGPHFEAAQARLTALEALSCPIWISWQVLREYLAVVTRDQAGQSAMPMANALEDVARLQQSFEIALETPGVFNRLTLLLATLPGSGKQVHDANLVATMLEHGVRRLLTYNQRDFRRFAGLIDLEPV
jgi:predicted nucleic acid-binding protein